MPFSFGKRSLERLIEVHPDLHAVASRAIELSEIDFGILEGLRSPERQADLVAAGSSRTLQSKHIIGHAIDVAAYIEGVISWDWHLYPGIARAFQAASRELAVPVVWGAVWDRQLASMTSDLSLEVDWYKARRGGKCFLDGGHFELRTLPSEIRA